MVLPALFTLLTWIWAWIVATSEHNESQKTAVTGKCGFARLCGGEKVVHGRLAVQVLALFKVTIIPAHDDIFGARWDRDVNVDVACKFRCNMLRALCVREHSEEPAAARAPMNRGSCLTLAPDRGAQQQRSTHRTQTTPAAVTFRGQPCVSALLDGLRTSTRARDPVIAQPVSCTSIGEGSVRGLHCVLVLSRINLGRVARLRGGGRTSPLGRRTRADFCCTQCVQIRCVQNIARSFNSLTRCLTPHFHFPTHRVLRRLLSLSPPPASSLQQLRRKMKRTLLKQVRPWRVSGCLCRATVDQN